MENQDQIEKKYKRELDKKKGEYNISQAENIKRSRVFDNLYSEISSSFNEKKNDNLEDEDYYSNYERALKRKLEIDKKNKKIDLKKQAQEKIKKEAFDKAKKVVAKKILAAIAPHLIYIIPILLIVIFLFFIILYISSIFEVGRNYDDYSEIDQTSSREIKEDYDKYLKEDWEDEEYK